MEQVQAYTEEQLKTAGWVFEKDSQPDPTMPRYAFVTMTDGSATLTEDDKAILASCDGLFLRGTGLGETPGRCFSPYSLPNGQVRWYAVYGPDSLLYLVQSYTGVLSIIGKHSISDPSAVRITAQSLDDAQKKQACNNIGAVFAGDNLTLNVIRLTKDEIIAGAPKDEADRLKRINAHVIIGDSGRPYFKGSDNGISWQFYSVSFNSALYIINMNMTTGVISGGITATPDGSVPGDLRDIKSITFAYVQNISNTQKATARGNMNVKSVDELLADDDFITQLKTKLGLS